MKLQLWTTNANGDPGEFLGEVEVSDEYWINCTSASCDAFELLQNLADEVNGGV